MNRVREPIITPLPVAPVGDEFETMLRDLQGRVLRFVSRLVPRPDEAAELTQEAFLQAFRSRDRYDRSRPFAPWMFRIALNVCRNHRRAGARRERPEPFPEAAVAFWTEPGIDAEAAASRAQTLARLETALQAVSAEDRELLLLRHCEGLSYHEIASIYGRPETVLKMRVHRALRRLRQAAGELLQ